MDPEWLQQRLGKVRIFDATLHLDPNRNAIKEFTDVGSGIHFSKCRNVFPGLSFLILMLLRIGS